MATTKRPPKKEWPIEITGSPASRKTNGPGSAILRAMERYRVDELFPAETIPGGHPPAK